MPSKPETGFVWNDKSHRWRDNSSGRYISQKRMTTMRDTYIDLKKSPTGCCVARSPATNGISKCDS